jgi:hypothetical protein
MHRMIYGILPGILSSCAVSTYPGQPGLVTNGYSKIDLEVLMEDGLWVYETTYDNTPKGKGVSAIVTKLYPNARTYTTNVRTNEFGTLYRAKAPYQGGVVQMISFPLANQYVVPPDSHVMFLVDYEAPLDEVDDRNLAEEGIFGSEKIAVMDHPEKKLNNAAMEFKSFKFKLLKAGNLDTYGNISYEIKAVDFGSKTFTPDKSVRIETNLLQTGLRTNVDQKTRSELVRFLDYHFPQGFKGNMTLHVNGEKIPFTAPFTLKTPNMVSTSTASWTVSPDALVAP